MPNLLMTDEEIKFINKEAMDLTNQLCDIDNEIGENTDYNALINNYVKVLKHNIYVKKKKRDNDNEYDIDYIQNYFLMFKGLKKKCITEIHTCLKYSMNPDNIKEPIDMLWDINIKYILEFYQHNNKLNIFLQQNQIDIYNILVNSFKSQDFGDIYKPMSFYKEGFNNILNEVYIKDKQQVMLKDLFNPPLDLETFQKYLIPHSEYKKLYATTYNRDTEKEIMQILQYPNQIVYEFNPAIMMNFEDYNFPFNEPQRNAIKHCLQNKVTFLMGGGGTGKTTILRALQLYFNKNKEKSLYCTISTKAKQVIQIKLGQDVNVSSINTFDVKTIASAHFIRGQYDNIIIDEASMIGNIDMLYFLRKSNKRTIFVGDTKQILPVLCWGNPFIALQDCTYINKSTLTQVCRQNEGLLSKFIQDIVDKKQINIPEYDNQTEGVYYITLDESNYSKEFVKLYIKCNNIFKDFGCIKCAKIEQPNKDIQTEIFKHNKPITKYYGNNFYEGDKVIRTCNATLPNDIEIANGTFGSLCKQNDKIIVDYGNNIIEEVDKTFCSNFKLAYVSTSHKYQGSENDTILFNLNNNFNLYYRSEGRKNLFYTSITRAKKLLLIVGTKKDKSLIQDLSLANFATCIHDFPM